MGTRGEGEEDRGGWEEREGREGGRRRGRERMVEEREKREGGESKLNRRSPVLYCRVT